MNSKRGKCCGENAKISVGHVELEVSLAHAVKGPSGQLAAKDRSLDRILGLRNESSSVWHWP